MGIVAAARPSAECHWNLRIRVRATTVLTEQRAEQRRLLDLRRLLAHRRYIQVPKQTVLKVIDPTMNGKLLPFGPCIAHHRAIAYV